MHAQGTRAPSLFRAALRLQCAAVLVCCVPLAAYAVSSVRLVLLLAPVSLFVVAAVLRLLELSTGARREAPDGTAPAAPPAAVLVLAGAGSLDPLTRTLAATRSLRLPGGLAVCVADGAGRPEVRTLATAYAAGYATGSDLSDATRNALEQTPGELVLVLEEGEAPAQDVLLCAAPAFADEAVAAVTTAIVATAVVTEPAGSPDRSAAWVARGLAGRRSIDLGALQPARDAADALTSEAVATTYRRSALEGVGARLDDAAEARLSLLRAGFAVRHTATSVVTDTGAVGPREAVAHASAALRGQLRLLSPGGIDRVPRLGWRARVAYWADGVSSLAAGAAALVVPLFAVAMLWYHPGWVTPGHTALLLAAVPALAAPALVAGTLDVLRTQVLAAFAYAAAATSAALGTPVGRVLAPERFPLLVLWLARAVPAGSLALVWLGLARAGRHGPVDVAVLAVLAALATWVLAPVVLLRAGRTTVLPAQRRRVIDLTDEALRSRT